MSIVSRWSEGRFDAAAAHFALPALVDERISPEAWSFGQDDIRHDRQLERIAALSLKVRFNYNPNKSWRWTESHRRSGASTHWPCCFPCAKDAVVTTLKHSYVKIAFGTSTQYARHLLDTMGNLVSPPLEPLAAFTDFVCLDAFFEYARRVPDLHADYCLDPVLRQHVAQEWLANLRTRDLGLVQTWLAHGFEVYALSSSTCDGIIQRYTGRTFALFG